jgi:MFS transporter, DHA1 family, tetracycline resistance protein
MASRDLRMTSAPASRASVTFILVTVALDVLALGLVIPVLPMLVRDFLGGDTARAATIFGLMSVTWALMQFVFAPILGALSDTYGRRPVLLFSNFGLGLDYILMALAPTLAWLFVGRILSGIAAATFSTAAAYIADVTPAEKRAAAFGMIGASFGIGFVLGPAIGGLLGAYDPRLPFWVAAGLSLANAVYGYFVLPESLAPAHRTPFRFKTANPAGAIKLLFGQANLRDLSSILFLYHLAHAVLPAVFVLYAAYRFDWGPREVGGVLAIVGICSAIVQAVLTGKAVARFGARTTLLIGLIAGASGFLVQGITTNPWVYVLGIPMFSLWGFISPAAMQLMTARIGADGQGQLQGANASLMSIANLIGPLVFSSVFAWAIAGGPGAALAGAPFIMAAALLAVATVLAVKAAAKPGA